jgi:hypothetical protein
MGHISCWSADDDLLGDNINAIKKTRDTLTDASQEDGLEVNTENQVCIHVITSLQG